MLTKNFNEYLKLTAAQFSILSFLLISVIGRGYVTCDLAMKYLVNPIFHSQFNPLASFRQRVFNPGWNEYTLAEATSFFTNFEKILTLYSSGNLLKDVLE